MKSSKQEIIIDHSPKQLYEIVLDIEKYPDFIPWCREIIIKYKSKNQILADMKVKYSFFSMQTFTSNVHFDKKNLTASSLVKSKFISKKTSIESNGFEIGDNGNIINFNGKTKLIIK